MTRRQAVAGVLGLAALVSVLVAEPSLPVEPLVGWFGSDYVVVAAIGGLIVVLSAPLLAAGREANLEQTETPDPERPATAPVAGRRLEERRTSAVVALPFVGSAERVRLRERLRTVVTGTLVRTGNCDRESARARVERGDWSDDPVATTYLAEGRRLSPRALAGALRHGEPPHGYAVRRVAAEVRRRGGGESA